MIKRNRMEKIKKEIHVNIPYRMLIEGYLERFVEEGLNPEIGFDAMALDKYSTKDFYKTAQVLRENSLKVTLHAPFIDLSPGSPDPEIRNVVKKRFAQLMDAVTVFRPICVVFHTGWDRKRYMYIKESYISQSLKIWMWISDELRKKGSVPVLENVFEKEPDELMYIYKPLKDYGVKLCFDIGHMMAFGNHKAEEWLRVIGDEIYQLHLHDNRGSADEHAGIGMGRIDFKAIFDYLKAKSHRAPIITLEPHREEELYPAIEYLERLWPWEL